jgi:hypothetical protein
MWKSSGHIPWVRALRLFMCTEDSSLKFYKFEFALELEKEQIVGAKNDLAMRKSPEQDS